VLRATSVALFFVLVIGVSVIGVSNQFPWCEVFTPCRFGRRSPPLCGNARVIGVSNQFPWCEVFTPCRFGRRSPPLCGNARVGPPAMSLVHSKFFSNCISAVVKIPLYQLPIRKHFSSQIVLSGRTGGGVFFERKRRKKAHRMGRPKRVFKTAGMPTSNGWVGLSVT